MPDQKKQRRIAKLGPLHDLMLKACPPNKENAQSIAILADLMGYTPAGLYAIISKNQITPQAARKIVNVSVGTPHEGAVTLEDFHPYVYC